MTLEFVLEFMTPVSPKADDAVKLNETEIFIPRYHYGFDPIEVWVSDGEWEYSEENQTLYFRHTKGEANNKLEKVEVAPPHAPPISPTDDGFISSTVSHLSNLIHGGLRLIGYEGADSSKGIPGLVTSDTIKSGRTQRQPSVISIPSSLNDANMSPTSPLTSRTSFTTASEGNQFYEVHWIRIKSLRISEEEGGHESCSMM
jgi:hypothetical protein